MHTLAIHKVGHSIRQRGNRHLREAVRWGLILVILYLLTASITGRPQSSNGSNGGGQHPTYTPRDEMSGMDSPGDVDPAVVERRLRMLNMERQKEMVNDTNKLLRLAKELNDEVAAAHSNTLTPEQLHKIAEIEKLARSVKERMTSGAGPAPTLMPQVLIPYPAH